MTQLSVAHAQQQNVTFAYFMLPLHEVDRAAPLLRCGFSRVTTLSYLSRDLSVPVDLSPTQLYFEGYDPVVFHEILSRTYNGSLDFPEVIGVRTIDEIIEFHRAQGFVPGRWVLAKVDGKPVGVLMMNAKCDFSYVGLVPEARGRGFGFDMMRYGILMAQDAGAKQVTLYVDNRNTPALRLYHRMGFVVYDTREVFLAIWRGENSDKV